MTQTPSVHLTQPTVGGDSGVWGGETNLNWTLVDRAINGQLDITIPDTNITLSHDGSNTDQSIYAIWNFLGALTANRTVTVPANVKIGRATNNTTGGHQVTLGTGSGSTITVPSGGITQVFQCDGTNVFTPFASVGANGFTSDFNGALLRQWGTGTSDATFGQGNVTFPTPFPNACFGAWAIISSGGPGAFTVTLLGTPSKTAVTFQLSNGSAPLQATFYWWALGN